MVKSFERSMKRTTQLKQIQEFIINNLAQKVVSIDDQSLFDCAEEIKMHRYKLFENTIINFDMWINRNDDKALFNDITDISKMMGAKIVYSDCTSPEFEYLYPCEFKDTETSHLFSSKIKFIKSKLSEYPNIKVVKLEYIIDTYLNLKRPEDPSKYYYKFPLDN